MHTDKLRFELILRFLRENQDRFSSRNKSFDILKYDGVARLYEHYLFCKNQKLTLTDPTTIPDNAVSIILQKCRNYTADETDRIKYEHQISMMSENLVGALLERYIAKSLEPHGWVWCAGDFVKAIDFIRLNQETNLWEAVQVKNRNNTENSSSSAIRNGTDIKKWFRTYSKPSSRRSSNTNWENFPEPQFRNQLSEDGFLDFISDYLS